MPTRRTDARTDARAERRAPRRAAPVQLKAGCSCGGGCPSCQASTDRFEIEADSVADRVMAMRAVPALTPTDPDPMREPEAAGLAPDAAPALGAGHPLPPDLASFFGARFGRDFGAVRLHRDAGAADAARSLGARAYAHGRDIAFARGEYQPDSPEGLRLLAHELTHVAQQGHAPPTAPGTDVQAAPDGVQRLCGPTEIRDVPGCTVTGGDIFGEPFLFDVNCDTFRPGELARLRSTASARLSPDIAVHVHGFASEDGDSAFNEDLSCQRANAAAQELLALGIHVTGLFAHGGTPGSAAERRSIVLDPRAEATPQPVEEEEPTPEPEPTPDGCGSFERFVASVLNTDPNLVADLVECLCEGIKLADVLESLAQIIGSGLLSRQIAAVIEKLDCACNVYDWLQLIYESGLDDGCFSWSAISRSDWIRIGGFAGATLVDCFSQRIMNLLVDTIAGLVAGGTTAGGAGAGSAVGPEGTAGGGGIGAVVGLAIREFFKAKGREVADLLVDLLLYLAQNSITHGSPFPLDGCRSCMRIPSYFGYDDMSGYCDQWNEDLVPEALRVPQWHGTATGARPSD